MKTRFKQVTQRALPLFAVIGAVACTPLTEGKPDYDVRPLMAASTPVVSTDDSYYQSAVDAIKKRNYGLALDFLQAARTTDPNSARVLNAFGVVYDKLGRFDLSARYYAEAKTADPQSTVVANNIAYSHVLQHLINGDVTPAQLAATVPASQTPVVVESETKIVPVVPHELAQAPVPLQPAQNLALADTGIQSLDLASDSADADAHLPPREIEAAQIELPAFQADRVVAVKPTLPLMDAPPVLAETNTAPQTNIAFENVASDFLFQAGPTVPELAPSPAQDFADLNALASDYRPALAPAAVEPSQLEGSAPQLLPTTPKIEIAPVETAEQPMRELTISPLALSRAETSPDLSPMSMMALDTAAVQTANVAMDSVPAALSESMPVVRTTKPSVKAFVARPAENRKTKPIAVQVPRRPLTRVASLDTHPVTIATAPVRVAPKNDARPAYTKLAAISTVTWHASTPAPKIVLLTHHPLVIVNASAQRSVDESIRHALERRNWTIAPARLVIPRRETQTTLFYPQADYAVAKALARTLSMPIHFVPNSCHCVGLRLVIGTNALNRKYSELQRAPFEVGALTPTLLGNDLQGRARW